jgi:hypothetical protein
LEPLELWARRGLRVRMALRVPWGLRDLQERRVLREFKVFRV